MIASRTTFPLLLLALGVTSVSTPMMAQTPAIVPTHAQIPTQTQAAPPAENYDSLRTRLDRIFFEQDLMVRNQKVDRSDLRHQEQEFQALKVPERIPFREDLPGLKSSLEESSKERNLKLTQFKPLPKDRKKPASVVSSMYSDENPNFKLTEDQLVERIPFEVRVQGSQEAVKAWIRSWPEDQMRLAEPDESYAPDASGPRAAGKNLWAVRAHAFRFREVKFPTLEPREPLELLPAWAKKDPESFAKKEPVLWNIIQQTHAITPQARPLYALRETLLLNSARMSFFVARAVPRRSLGAPMARRN